MVRKRKKIRLNLNRIRTSIFCLVLIICLSLGFRAAAANFSEAQTNPAYIEVIVKKGDSLWALTETYYKGNRDIRKIVYRIKEINNLQNAEIVPGQIIKIPQV